MATPHDEKAAGTNLESENRLIDPDTLARMEVSRIHPYAGNPRRQKNPEYDRIKASIRAEGLDQPLVVTREPGSDDYVLQAGGNTRLSILKELHQETGEERFLRVNCLIKPWHRESNLLLAHLRENELRGGLSFIDKALAVFEAKRLLEHELEIETLSQRHLAALLHERGFGVGHDLISRMGYAVHTLWPLMPNALSAGLGRPQIEKIRSLERVARRIWQRRALGEEAEFDMIFAELCRRYDDVDWDIGTLRAALENEIAQEAEQSLQGIRLEMDAYLAGKEFVVVDSTADNTESSTGGSSDNGKPPKGALETTVSPVSPTDDFNRADTTDHPTGTDTGEDGSGDRDFDDPGSRAVSPQSNSNNEDPADRIATLRTQAWTLASRLAERNGLGDLIIELPDQGLGFLLRDVPAPELTGTLDQALLGQVSTLWWQLAACSELTVAPAGLLGNTLAPDTVLRQALAVQDAGLLFEAVWTVDPGQTGDQLWQQLSDPDWQDLLALMTTYRDLKRLALATGRPLWVAGDH